MKTQPEINPALHQVSHEMLLRLLKVAELLNKGAHKSERPVTIADKTGSTSPFAENERKKP